MIKPIFWNEDTQYNFMRPSGKLYLPGAEAIEKNLRSLTAIAARNNIYVVNTADWHMLESAELSATPDFKTTFPPHCLIGSEGAEFIDATRPPFPYVIDWRDASFDPAKVKEHFDIVIYKDNFDVFNAAGAPHTEKVLDALNPRRAIVYGVATNVCVDFAVKGLLQRGLQVYVPTDAIKELPGSPLEAVLDSWKKEGAVLIRTDEVSKYI